MPVEFTGSGTGNGGGDTIVIAHVPIEGHRAGFPALEATKTAGETY